MKRGEFYRRVLDRDGNGDKDYKAKTRVLSCGHIVPHAATISYNQETGRATHDRYVWCHECEKAADQ
jgi:hypothetical protein